MSCCFRLTTPAATSCATRPDRADATALLEAHRNEQISPVPVKTLHQQTLATLHRLRSGWIATRTARINAIRGLLRELGIIIPLGSHHLLPRLQAALADPADPMPPALHPTLMEAAAEIRELEERIHQLERQLKALSNCLTSVQRLLTIPGIGLLTATALVGFVGEVSRFPSGRRFAGYLGLVPREHSSGEHRRLGAITQNRRGHNRATVALANKLARIAWAVWTRDIPFQATIPEVA